MDGLYRYEPKNDQFKLFQTADGLPHNKVNAIVEDDSEGIALRIFIHPPWYWNGWSQGLYLILLIGLILSVYHFQLNRRLAIAEVSRLQELDELKTRLYTKITHEFRTPLIVIKGLAGQIKGYEDEKEGIKRNTAKILKLIKGIPSLISRFIFAHLPPLLVDPSCVVSALNHRTFISFRSVFFIPALGLVLLSVPNLWPVWVL